MLIALLAVLGVGLIVFVAFVAVVLDRRRADRGRRRLPLPCHYKDGTFRFARVQELCAKRSPETGAPFSFWHPDLVTLHVWLWYPNPDGLYAGTNPLVSPFNEV
jgi:hypothetical protein